MGEEQLVDAGCLTSELLGGKQLLPQWRFLLLWGGCCKELPSWGGQGEQSSLLGGPVCAPGWEIAIEFRAWEMTENLAANATFQAPVQKPTEESQQPELWYLAGRALRMQLFGCPLCYPISFVLTGFASGMLHSAGSSPASLCTHFRRLQQLGGFL